jgi:hypothetical protein
LSRQHFERSGYDHEEKEESERCSGFIEINRDIKSTSLYWLASMADSNLAPDLGPGHKRLTEISFVTRAHIDWLLLFDQKMPDTRALQTYSALLEDRRIMETAAEAREPPSLVLHLLEKEWSIRPGRNQNSNGPGARRFSYAQPISVHFHRPYTTVA